MSILAIFNLQGKFSVLSTVYSRFKLYNNVLTLYYLKCTEKGEIWGDNQLAQASPETKFICRTQNSIWTKKWANWVFRAIVNTRFLDPN